MSTDQTNGRQADDPSQTSDPSADVEPSPDSSEAEESSSGPEGEAAEEAEQKTEVEALREQIEELEAERDELNDRLLRKAAEFENYRRRADREKKRRHEAGMLEVIEPILEVLDDFERSINAAQDLRDSQDVEAAYDSLKGGVEMVFRKFRDALETLGVEPIEAEGKPLDENLHEAMMRQPSEEAEPGTVVQEIRKGYRMGDRVIRHSRVVVASEPERDEGEESA